MSDKRTSVEVKTGGPRYLAWRGELLAELALARLTGVAVHRRPDQAANELPYDFAVIGQDGFCFFVEVRAFSSSRLGVADVATIPELRCSLTADRIRRAHHSRCPFVLFLFDADTDHGRYLRLNTIPAPGPGVRQMTVHLPVENTIGKETLQKLFAELQSVPAA